MSEIIDGDSIQLLVEDLPLLEETALFINTIFRASHMNILDNKLIVNSPGCLVKNTKADPKVATSVT